MASGCGGALSRREKSLTFFLDLLVEVPEINGLVRGDVAGEHRRRRRRGGERQAGDLAVSGREILVGVARRLDI